MPTVLVVGPYRLFFYSNENSEPAHVHVERDDKEAKYWLDPVRLARNDGFRAHELSEIERIIRDNITLILKKWHAHFGKSAR